MRDPKRIYVTMVADLFHHGHVEFLRRAREYGDYLVVGVISDSRAERRKRRPILTLEERIRVVRACRYVDEAWEHTVPVDDGFMMTHQFDLKVYATVDEAENEERVGRYQRQGLDPRYYRRIDYTRDISTTRIIRRILDRTDL